MDDNSTPHPPPISRRWVSEKQASDHLGCSMSTLAKDRVTGLLGIHFYRLGRHIRYKIEDLDVFLESTRNQVRHKRRQEHQQCQIVLEGTKYSVEELSCQ